jgi:hypothetical protein
MTCSRLPWLCLLTVFRREGLYGALGSFWHNEMSAPANGSPLLVGPVPETERGLPTSLALDYDESGVLRVAAHTSRRLVRVYRDEAEPALERGVEIPAQFANNASWRGSFQVPCCASIALNLPPSSHSAQPMPRRSASVRTSHK